MNPVALVFTIIAVSLMMRYFRNLAAKAPDVHADGCTVYRMGKFVMYLGGFCFLFGLAAPITALTGILPVQNSGDYYAVAGLFVLFTSLGLPLVLAAINHRAEVDDGKIVCYSWLGLRKELYWQDIRGLHYSKAMQQFYISGAQDKIVVSWMLTGIDTFVSMMKEKLPAPMIDKALQNFESTRQRML